jgi:hypothetical protein
VNATILVADVETKEGQGQKGPWKLYRVLDGNGDRFATFKADLGNTAMSLKGKRADITYSENDKGKNLESITEHVETQKSGGWDDPVRSRSILLQSSLKVATEIVNASAPANADSSARTRRAKELALDFAMWVEAAAERPFRGAAVLDEWSDPGPDDNIPFGEQRRAAA